MKIKTASGEIITLEMPYALILENNELSLIKSIDDSCNRILFFDDEKTTKEEAENFLII